MEHGRRSRLRRLGPAALAVGVVLALVAPAHAASAPYRFELYRDGDFVSQTNDVQCVGASMQMMLNMIGPADDRTAARQLELQNLARAHSPRRFGAAVATSNAPAQPVRQRRGASSWGWAKGLTLLGAGPYGVTSAATLDGAVALAAGALRRTGRPVGLLVWQGAHAWVMSGFESTADPATGEATITHVTVLDPWFPRVSRTWGRSPKPGTRLTLAQLAEDFVPWRPRSTSANANRFVVVLPFSPRVSSGSAARPV